MRGTVAIGGNNVEMAANAASSVFYRMCFKEDFKAMRQKLISGDLNEPQTQAELTDLFIKMGYIMSQQAFKDFPEVSFEGYVKWLTAFDPVDMDAAAEGIMELYHSQEKTTSLPKA